MKIVEVPREGKKKCGGIKRMKGRYGICRRGNGEVEKMEDRRIENGRGETNMIIVCTT